MQTCCSKHPTSHSSATVCLTVFSQMFQAEQEEREKSWDWWRWAELFHFCFFGFQLHFPSCVLSFLAKWQISPLYVCVCVGGGPTCVDFTDTSECVTFRTSTVVAVLLLELQETFRTASLPGASGVAETNCCSTSEVESRKLICTHGFKNLVHSFQKHQLKMYWGHMMTLK